MMACGISMKREPGLPRGLPSSLLRCLQAKRTYKCLLHPGLLIQLHARNHDHVWLPLLPPMNTPCPMQAWEPLATEIACAPDDRAVAHLVHRLLADAPEAASTCQVC